jgi:hypothetical protein
MNIHLERWFSNPSLLPLNSSPPFSLCPSPQKKKKPQTLLLNPTHIAPSFSSLPLHSLIKVPPKLGNMYIYKDELGLALSFHGYVNLLTTSRVLVAFWLLRKFTYLGNIQTSTGIIKLPLI